MRIALAFRCFFRLLFGGTLPADAAPFLPVDARPALPAPAPPAAAAPVAAPAAVSVQEKLRPAVAAPAKNQQEQHKEGALAMLGLLQREGRLIDFLQEKLDTYSDADIGAAARDIHRGCKKVLEDHFTLEPVMPGMEDDRIRVPEGFDPGEVRLVGEVNGRPPFQGVLRHHGWRVTQSKLPTLSEGVDRRVLAPAEVELAS